MTPVIKGEIGYLKLTRWWLSEFTEVERCYIESVYQPLGMISKAEHPLTHGNVTYNKLTVMMLLTCLATWFQAGSDRHLARRMLTRAEQELPLEQNIMTINSFWNTKRETYYLDGEKDPEALKIAIQACREQVAIAVKVAEEMRLHYSSSVFPEHRGYQLLINLEMEKQNYSEVIRLCQEAKFQGWSGNWEQQISSCRKFLK